MNSTKTGKLLVAATMLIVAVFALQGCGGGGGSSASAPANATINGRVSIVGTDNCSGVIVIAEKVQNGVTRTVARMMEEASAGRRSSARLAADAAGVYTDTTNGSCDYKLTVPEDSYSVYAYKEDTVAAQPRKVAARAAAAVTVNFDLVATGKVAGVVAIGVAGSDIVLVYLDGTSFAAFADAGGNYTISNIPVGTYDIKFARQGRSYGGNTGVVVAAGATTNSNLTSFSLACVSNTDCDDSDSATYERCDNPGTLTSACQAVTAVKAGALTADTTWSGDVLVLGQVEVPMGVTLTIDPGARIMFDYPASGMVIFPGQFSDLGGILVDGTLTAVGTSSDPIVFTLWDDVVGNGAGSWGGIYFQSNQTGSSLQYAQMQYPSFAIQVYNAAPTISDITITDAGYMKIATVGGSSSSSSSSSYSYHIYVKTQKGWEEVAVRHHTLSYDLSSIDLTGSLPDADGEYKLRVEQVGMHAAQIDSVGLMLNGQSARINHAYDLSNGENAVFKLASNDNDVVDAHLKTYEISFDAPSGIVPRSAMLTLTAREEGTEVVEGGRPFYFPMNAFYQTMATAHTYTYKLGSARGALQLDGQMTDRDMLSAPVFTEFAQPNSGHPAGQVYGYMKNDGRFLYTTIDFTPDNTYDGDADYATLHIKVGNEFKSFRVSVPETSYGQVGFTYTRNANYQHKVYEFAIPLSEIGNPKQGDAIQYVVEAYGTASGFDGVVSIMNVSDDFSMSNISISLAREGASASAGGGQKLVARKSKKSAADRKAKAAAAGKKSAGNRVAAASGASAVGHFYGLKLSGVSGSANSLSNITVDGAAMGAGFFNVSNMAIDGLHVTNTRKGNGITFMSGGAISCSNCSSENTRYSNGLRVDGISDITFSDCSFNFSGSDSAYLSNLSGTNSFTNCDFSYNMYGFEANYVSADIVDSRIDGNCNNGIYAYSSTINISNSNIINNNNYAIYAYSSTITTTGAYLAGNYGAGAGVADMSTVVPYSDSSPGQYYGLNTVTSPASAAVTGPPAVTGIAPFCGGGGY